MMKNVFCRRSLLFAVAFGISLVEFSSVADAGRRHFRRGCRPVCYPCQPMTYRSVPCQRVTYRCVPCPPVQCAPTPCIPAPTPKAPPPPSGVLLEVVDLVDPLELGAVGTYVITVTNQGSILAIDNIEIIVLLPEQLEYMSSEGPTEGSAEGQVIRYAPLETLNAGEEVEYRLKARAVGLGDIRFQLELTTDQSPEPITETESTNLYE